MDSPLSLLWTHIHMSTCKQSRFKVCVCIIGVSHTLLGCPVSSPVGQTRVCLSLDHVPLNSYPHFKHLTDSILGVVHSFPVLPILTPLLLYFILLCSVIVIHMQLHVSPLPTPSLHACQEVDEQPVRLSWAVTCHLRCQTVTCCHVRYTLLFLQAYREGRKGLTYSRRAGQSGLWCIVTLHSLA